MATCKITEYNGVGGMNSGLIQVPTVPALAHQSITFTTATASAAFNANTRIVKLYPSADCYVYLCGAATVNHEFLKGSTDHWRSVAGGGSVSIYDGSS
jgi:hypothetical protein